MSTISYNSRFLKQFDAIGDSISQIGNENAQITSNETSSTMFDLSTVHVELGVREAKIKELQ
jgi:hypothetical protein